MSTPLPAADAAAASASASASADPSPTPAVRPHGRPTVTAHVMRVVLVLLGAALCVGGGWLLVLGGSAYYVVAGLLTLTVGVLLPRRWQVALALQAVVVVLTLAWATWEAGLDWWPLAIRLDVAALTSLLLLLPMVRKPPGTAAGLRPAAWPLSRLALAAALIASAGVAMAALLRDANSLPGRIERPALPAPVAAAAGTAGPVPAGEWHAWGRTAAGQRYSPLAEIAPGNVDSLEVAWQFRTGDVRGRPGDPEETTFEVTPLKIGERLFLCTPHQAVVALDAVTGRQAWRRDLGLPAGLALQHLTCRGLSYQPPRADAAPGPCTSKLFMPTADGRLVALDPNTGDTCPRFGGPRGVNLWAGMPNVKPGAYYSTSPPVVTRDLVIVGGTVLDNASVREQSGVIRAYDIETGVLVWNWDAAEPDLTAPIGPGQTYTPNSPNSWSVSSVDEGLGLVYVPMGNQPPDQFGGRRTPAVERYSSSVVALELATGRVRWVFQTVHHDLWDYDVPAQPVLVDLQVGGQEVPALVQPTKQGELFVLDRRTGTPVFPVTEVAVPQRTAPGDRAAATQPVSAISLAPPVLAERDMWGGTVLDQLACRIAFRRLHYEGRFTPPSLQGTLVHPGNFGVFNWGSIAVDPVRRIAFTTPASLAFTSKLVPRADDTTLLVQKAGPPAGSLPALNENFGAPYAAAMAPFTSPLGIPCQEPPWGSVAGIDLDSGRVAWKHRNGTVRDLSPLPLPFRMGVPNLGGPLMTASGLAFLSGTLDNYVRAYDVLDGRELWKSRLPAGGQATPMTYQGADGRQYLLVVAGGHGSTGTQAGDHVIAYALPRTNR